MVDCFSTVQNKIIVYNVSDNWKRFVAIKLIGCSKLAHAFYLRENQVSVMMSQNVKMTSRILKCSLPICK